MLSEPVACFLGTSSWYFDAWRGVFYPDDLSKSDYLTYYARHFPTVETNTSYYALPRESVVRGWTESVPDGFTFSLKFPRIISHEKRLVECGDESQAFLALLHTLGAAAAPGFLQLPPTFTRQNGGRSLADYLDWLATVHNGLRLAVEVRSADLMTPAFARFVAERGFALVLVDRVDTTDLYPVWLALIREGVAPDFVMIRWIGDDKNGPQGDRELTAPREADLTRWAQRLTTLAHAGVRAFGYMHNPYEGHAPASVRRLLARLPAAVRGPEWAPDLPLPPDQPSLFDF